MSPWLLFACLNSPIVQRQIRSNQFTQDIIDTLGKRLFEIILPIPKKPETRKYLSEQIQYIINTRISLRNQAKQIVKEVASLKKDVELPI